MFFSGIISQKACDCLKAKGATHTGFLSHVDYQLELSIKNQALSAFFKQHKLLCMPKPVIASPKPRQYRTTTKRHVIFQNGYSKLSFSIDPKDIGSSGNADLLLEPKEHLALYAFIEEKLKESFFRPLLSAMNFVIIRGSYIERSLILNVFKLNGEIIKRARVLAERAAEFDPLIVSGFIFLDPEKSAYYLDTTPIYHNPKIKKLFGSDFIKVFYCGKRYLFPPAVFSQVNESIVPDMLGTAKALLSPAKNQHLVDLYCGYGLFTHYLSPHYAHACGLETSRDSVEAARHNGSKSSRTVFNVCRISGSSFLNQLPKPDIHEEAVLSDPPRHGMQSEVIAGLLRRAPIKVLLACCGIEELPRQISVFESRGYRVTEMQPLDMFAGTPHIEILVLFEQKKRQLNGFMNR